MAINWDFEITPIDIPNKIVGVFATRTDDGQPDLIYVVTLKNADISTSEKKMEVLNVLWAKYQRKVEEQIQFDTIESEITELELQAKDNFENREIE